MDVTSPGDQTSHPEIINSFRRSLCLAQVRNIFQRFSDQTAEFCLMLIFVGGTFVQFPIGFTKENIASGPNLRIPMVSAYFGFRKISHWIYYEKYHLCLQFKNPHGICIFWILHNFPLNLLRKISPQACPAWKCACVA